MTARTRQVVVVPQARGSAERLVEDRWSLLFEQSPVGIGAVDAAGCWVVANAALCTLLGRCVEDVVGRDASELVGPHPEAREPGAASGTEVERQLRRADGSSLWVGGVIARIVGADGRPLLLGHFRDLSEARAARRTIVESAGMLRAVARVIREIHSGSDPRRSIIAAAMEIGQASYVSLAEAVDGGLRVTASNIEALVGTRTRGAGLPLVEEAVATGHPTLVVDPAGDPRVPRELLALTGARSVLVHPVLADGELCAALVVGWDERVTDLSDQRAEVMAMLGDEVGIALRQGTLVDELRLAARTDPLTGLLNRRAWDETIGHLMATAGELTIGLADVDHFKAYNDRNGHLAGDAMLRDIAQAATAVLRPGDTACRWGGEEFAFAFSGCSGEATTAVFERLRGSLPAGVTWSIGQVTWDGVESADALLARADLALYAAKQAGRNRVVAGSPAGSMTQVP